MRVKNLVRAMAVPAAFGIALATSTAANAHYVYFAEIVWSNPDSSRCLMNYSETSHGSNGGGYFKGQARSQAEVSPSPTDCILPWQRNTGMLAEGQIIYKWSVDQWVICDRTDQWYFNNGPASTYQLVTTAPASGPCGSGYYGLDNIAAMNDNGEWHGWNVTNWSGYHWLPDTSGLSANSSSLVPTTEAEGAPPKPEWMNPNSGVKAPDAIPVADENGNLVKNKDGSLFKVSPLMPKPTKHNGTTKGGQRSVTVDKDGNVTESVTVERVRPRP